MKLSFNDEELFKEAVGSLSLRFNNPPLASDLNTLQQMGSSMLPQDSERKENIRFNNDLPSDPNILRRAGTLGSSSSIVGNLLYSSSKNCPNVWAYCIN